MHISKKAEYALRALLAISRQSAKSWSIPELASQERIPVKFLEQILLSLRRCGILASKRGVGGGYTLIRPPHQISLLDVISIFDGPVTLIPCAVSNPVEPCSCSNPRACPVRDVMMAVRKEVIDALNRRTIDDLLKSDSNPSTLAFDI